MLSEAYRLDCRMGSARVAHQPCDRDADRLVVVFRARYFLLKETGYDVNSNRRRNAAPCAAVLPEPRAPGNPPGRGVASATRKPVAQKPVAQQPGAQNAAVQPDGRARRLRARHWRR